MNRGNAQQGIGGDLSLCDSKTMKKNQETLSQGNQMTISLTQSLERPSPMPCMQKGSITLEASLTITFFLLFFLTILRLFWWMDFQLSMHLALERLGDETVAVCSLMQTELGEKTGEWTGLGEISKTIYDAKELVLDLLPEEIEEYLGLHQTAWLANQVLCGRFRQIVKNQGYEKELPEGISFADSKLDFSEGNVTLVLSCPLPDQGGLLLGREREMVISCFRYTWLGDGKNVDFLQEAKEAVQMVYVTAGSQVYHLEVSCTHLTLSTREVPLEGIYNRRNQNGGKYYPCEICRPDESLEVVYITNQGDRFHAELSCRGLKRTYFEIPLSNVEGKRVCSRCQSRQEENRGEEEEG